MKSIDLWVMCFLKRGAGEAWGSCARGITAVLSARGVFRALPVLQGEELLWGAQLLQ